MEKELNLISIGSLYVSDFLNENEKPRGGQYSLDMVLDTSINAPRLKIVAPSGVMYGKYWYRSGINSSMKLELKNIVETIKSRFKLVENDIWLDIACNDGTLLKNVPFDFIKLGIDPADNSYYNESSKVATVVQDYFSKSSYEKTGYGDKKCKVVTIIAMFYDIENPNHFCKDINNLLNKDGLWITEFSYLPLLLKNLTYDQICHEHVTYYSLSSFQKIIDQNNMKVIDFSFNEINGGSIEVICAKKISKFKPNLKKINNTLDDEKKINSVSYSRFNKRIENVKNVLNQY
jgi:hypothetical protein